MLLSTQLALGIGMFLVAELAPAKIQTWRKNALPQPGCNGNVNKPKFRPI
jgi:hypothetical protein